MRRVLGNRGIQTLQRGNDKKESSIISHCLWKAGAFWYEFIREEKYRWRWAPRSDQHKPPQITPLPCPDPLLKGHRNPATWLKPKTLSSLGSLTEREKKGWWVLRGGKVEQTDGFRGNRKTLSQQAGLPPDSRCQSWPLHVGSARTTGLRSALPWKHCHLDWTPTFQRQSIDEPPFLQLSILYLYRVKGHE